MNDKQSKSLLTGISSNVKTDIVDYTYYCKDPVIGKYAIKYEIRSEIKKSNYVKLASVIAQRRLKGRSGSVMIVKEFPQNNNHYKEVTLDELLSLYPRSVVEILDEALMNLALLIDHPSQKITIADDRIWILYSYDYESRDYILRQLSDLGYIKLYGSYKPIISPNYPPTITIESDGWARLQELQKKPSGGRDQAFVAMYFSEEMNEYYENSIKPVIEQNGTKCVRIDLQEHNNKICDEIIKEVKNPPAKQVALE